MASNHPYAYLEDVELQKLNDLLNGYNEAPIYLDFKNPDSDSSFNKDKRFFTIIDTVWLYSAYNDDNFISTEQKLAQIISDVRKGLCKIYDKEQLNNISNSSSGKGYVKVKKVYLAGKCRRY